jgi:hypothetical protein
MANRNPKNKDHKVIIKLDINYEKLADAILTAQKKSSNDNTIESPKEKPSLFRAIKIILFTNKDTGDRLTVGLLSVPIIVLFKLIAFIGFIIICYTMYKTTKELFFTSVMSKAFRQVFNNNWTEIGIILKNVFIFIQNLILSFASFLYLVIMWGASNELNKSRDKNFAISLFSGIVSFAALIISLIALKG